jgi:L-malate glycosyltransferase
MVNNPNTVTGKKIRVLHIIKSLGRGGAEMLLPETLKLHQRDRFEFHYIYFLPWKDQLVSSLTGNNVKVICLSANNNLQLLLRTNDVVKYIRNESIDVIHAHLPWAGIVARRAGKKVGIPVLYTEHNKQERYHFITRFLNLFTLNDLSHLIAVSDDVAGSVRKYKRNLKVPLQTIVNGVNTDHFDPTHISSAVRAQLGIAADVSVVGTIAVFRFQKRLELWLEVAAKILAQKPETRFIIVGDGPLKESILAKSRALQLDGKVYFVGLQEEVRPYLAAMDIYMMSSQFEGLPIALLEAMSFGLPIVSTNAGGIKQVVRHDVEGLVCDVNETGKLRTLLLKLLDDHNLRLEMGKRARTRVKESFSLNHMVEQLEMLYDSYSNH